MAVVPMQELLEYVEREQSRHGPDEGRQPPPSALKDSGSMRNIAPPSSAPAARATNGMTRRRKRLWRINTEALPTSASALQASPETTIHARTDTTRPYRSRRSARVVSAGSRPDRNRMLSRRRPPPFPGSAKFGGWGSPFDPSTLDSSDGDRTTASAERRLPRTSAPVEVVETHRPLTACPSPAARPEPGGPPLGRYAGRTMDDTPRSMHPPDDRVPSPRTVRRCMR